MTTLPHAYSIDPLSLLTEESFQSKISELWSEGALKSDRFYQTGYETILYNQNIFFAMETVMSSVISWDKEVLIIGPRKNCNEFKALAKNHSINGHTLCDANITGPKVTTILKFFPQISHVIIHVDSAQWLQTSNFKEIVQIAVNTGKDVIVTSTFQLAKLTDWFKSMVSFMVGCLNTIDKKSFVVARRNKLVQTEGNARNSRLDLYGYWQWSMRNRTPIIEPM